jgi:hypothetical protein
MRMMDNSADDEEQIAPPEKEINLPGHDSAESVSAEPRDYGALLAMTRPLVISKEGALSLGEGDCREEFALRKGEILCLGRSGLATTTALPQTRLNLRIRIHLGMS